MPFMRTEYHGLVNGKADAAEGFVPVAASFQLAESMP
jgi:hypothetical protein